MTEYIFTKDGIKSPTGAFLAFKTKPFDHQLKCLQQFGDAEYFALLAEMGTGKTWVIINNYAYLRARNLVQNMLVIAPNGVQWNWVHRELPMHLPQVIEERTAYAGYGGKMTVKEALNAADLVRESKKIPSIFCVNWDTLSTSRGLNLVLDFLNNRNCLVVLDESDYCKNPETKRSKAVLGISSLVKYKRIMTGTPITNSPFDAFMQFNFLSPKILRCSSFIAFKKRYGVFLPQNHPIVSFIKQHHSGTPLIQAKDANGRALYKNLDKLQELIKPVAFRVVKADCLDLPEKLYTNVYVELTKDMRTQYDAVKKAGLLSVEGKEINIATQMAILSQLCQITGNHIAPALISAYECESKIIDPEHNPKLEKALEIIQQALSNESKVIVWARYRAEIEDIYEACKSSGIKAVTYYGDTPEAERRSAIDAFQNGEKEVFISNQQSGGTGLTLTAANVVIYYSNSFSLHDRLQSEDRCHRIGQKKAVTYVNLLARNTVDEHIQRVLDNKQNIADAITSFRSLIS